MKYLFLIFLFSLGAKAKNLDSLSLGAKACTPRCANQGEDAYHPMITCGKGRALCCNKQEPILKAGKYICEGPTKTAKPVTPPVSMPSPSPSIDNRSTLSTPSTSNNRLSVGATSGKYKLLFVDYFQNLSQWTTETGLDTYTNTCASYVKENAFTNAAGLTLKVGPKTNNSQGKCCRGSNCSELCVLSGRVASNFSKKYGIFIFKAKVPKGPDLFPALWLTGIGDWPKTGEYDLMETVDTVNARSDFTSRVMIPISSDFTLDPKAKQYYVGVSVPPDDKPDDKVMVPADFFNTPHVFALDWYETADGDVKYDVYVDVKMENGMLVNLSDGQKAVPKKAYSLRDLVNKYRDYDCKCGWPPKYNLAAFEKIRDALKPHRMVMNIAVGGAWDGKKNNKGGCSNKKCGGCDEINDAMVVEYVQVWDKF